MTLPVLGDLKDWVLTPLGHLKAYPIMTEAIHFHGWLDSGSSGLDHVAQEMIQS